jgi:vacuolar-type H+-ATPase subunit H
MARSANFLERFRLAGTPGAAARAGVPADRVAELSAELAPVLAGLSGTVEEARRIRDQGATTAERIRQEGRERAASVVAQARRDAAAERSATAARAREQAERESRELLDGAMTEAEAVRRDGTAMVDAAVQRVLTAVRSSLAAGPAVDGDDR